MDLRLEFPNSGRRFDVYEVTLDAGKEIENSGNPFQNKITGIFQGEQETKEVEGFYDGNGIYRVRFMPSYEGDYTFSINADALLSIGKNHTLDQNKQESIAWDNNIQESRAQGNSTQESSVLTGSFHVLPAEEGNHGVLRVENQFHFAYEDKTRCYPIGTTCYVWNLQSKEMREETLKTLAASDFKKIRFCVFPKHYDYNLEDPEMFPYEGTPVDASGITHENFMFYGASFPGMEYDPSSENHWNLHRFHPAYFAQLEDCIKSLGKLGIEADLILFHPYDRWGFSCMSREEDDFYLHYITARLSAFHNIWWSMANEYDLMYHKTMDDWDHLGRLVSELDPYHHLISVHNCKGHFDFTKDWVTHCSIQRNHLYLTSELTDEWREKYGKPVVLDEIAYEGNIQHGWGNISGEEMTRRFWEAILRGGYPGHGETILDHIPTDAPEDHRIKLWWSHGGILKGQSSERISFLTRQLEQIPEHHTLKPWITPRGWDVVAAIMDTPEQEAKAVKDYYLFYYSFMNPMFRTFDFDEETEFEVDVIDTWNMTIDHLGVKKGHFTVPLPGRPYMAIRMVKKA